MGLEMFSNWPSWLSRSPRVRRTVIKLWRVFLRVDRATLAHAVLVIRRQDGRLLTLCSTSGELRLPFKELDGWRAVTTQVEEWLGELQLPQTPKLEAIDGTPSHRGVTFIYSAETATVREAEDSVWIDPELALPTLRLSDRRLVRLSRRS